MDEYLDGRSSVRSAHLPAFQSKRSTVLFVFLSFLRVAPNAAALPGSEHGLSQRIDPIRLSNLSPFVIFVCSILNPPLPARQQLQNLGVSTTVSVWNDESQLAFLRSFGLLC
jgi:hypothetical protein